MAPELPYLTSYKNVGELFQKILTAKQPDNFTTKFLADTIGLKSTTDRPLIAFLKVLGFLDSAGRPTPEYGQLKNQSLAAKAIGSALRRAYAPLYAANENAHTLASADLKGLIAQVAGADAGMTNKIQWTFSALVKLADFSGQIDEEVSPKNDEKLPIAIPSTDKPQSFGSLRPEFHYNIQVHLPANATEETYLNIFNSLRKAFKP